MVLESRITTTIIIMMITIIIIIIIIKKRSEVFSLRLLYKLSQMSLMNMMELRQSPKGLLALRENVPHFPSNFMAIHIFTFEESFTIKLCLTDYHLFGSFQCSRQTLHLIPTNKPDFLPSVHSQIWRDLLLNTF